MWLLSSEGVTRGGESTSRMADSHAWHLPALGRGLSSSPHGPLSRAGYVYSMVQPACPKVNDFQAGKAEATMSFMT